MRVPICLMLGAACLVLGCAPAPNPSEVYTAARMDRIRDVVGFDATETLVYFHRTPGMRLENPGSSLLVVVSRGGHVVRVSSAGPVRIMQGDLDPEGLAELTDRISNEALCRFEPGVMAVPNCSLWRIVLPCDGAMREYGTYNIPAKESSAWAAQSDRDRAIEDIGQFIETVTADVSEPLTEPDARAAIGAFRRELTKLQRAGDEHLARPSHPKPQ